VLDESALDVSIQAGVLNLFGRSPVQPPACSSRTISRWCGTSTGRGHVVPARSSRWRARSLARPTHSYPRAAVGGISPKARAKKRIILKGDRRIRRPPSGCRFHPLLEGRRYLRGDRTIADQMNGALPAPFSQRLIDCGAPCRAQNGHLYTWSQLRDVLAVWTANVRRPWSK
jgi:hypothetical protein